MRLSDEAKPEVEVLCDRCHEREVDWANAPVVSSAHAGQFLCAVCLDELKIPRG